MKALISLLLFASAAIAQTPTLIIPAWTSPRTDCWQQQATATNADGSAGDTYTVTICRPPKIDDCGTLPVTDTFSGSGVLSNCWTQSSVGIDVPLVRSSGVVIPNTAGFQGQATLAGVAFSTAHYVQGKLVWAAGNYSGICMGMSVPGTGACYTPASTSVGGYTTGIYTGNVIAGCAAFPSGDVVRLAVTRGSVYTVTDVTTSTVLCSGSGPGYTGNPGILVDHRNNSTDSITDLQVG